MKTAFATPYNPFENIKIDDAAEYKPRTFTSAYEKLFEQMKPGQSLICEPTTKHVKAVRSALERWIKKNGKPYTSRSVVVHDDGKGRVWLFEASKVPK